MTLTTTLEIHDADANPEELFSALRDEVGIPAAQLLAVFNARTDRGSGFRRATRNPYLWGALSLATLPLVSTQAVRVWRDRRVRPGGGT